MNIFLPFENDVQKSVAALDNKRLNKQILECYQLLESSLRNKDFKHPIFVHYKDNTDFLLFYGMRCCREYYMRKGHKPHKLHNYFCKYFETHAPFDKYVPEFVPFYGEGSKDKPECIRTTCNVSLLFQAKLIKKWLNDKYKPVWTIRGEPDFFVKYKQKTQDQQNDYWKYIEEIKNIERKNTQGE